MDADVKNGSLSVKGTVGRRVPLGLACACALARAKTCLEQAARTARSEEEGQGTTEYAILVGVLVVIAIVAIAAFRGRIQSLWDEIANGINGL